MCRESHAPGVHILLPPLALITVVGGVVTSVAAFFIIRGPFLGGEPLSPEMLLVAIGVMFASFIVTAYTGTKTARIWFGF